MPIIVFGSFRSRQSHYNLQSSKAAYRFGAIAVIFSAAPIARVTFAAVNLIYVRDTLGERTALTRKLD